MQVVINITLGEGETLFSAVKALLGMPDDAEVVTQETEPKRRGRKAKEEAAEAIVETVKGVLGQKTASEASGGQSSTKTVSELAGAVETVERSNVVPMERKPTFDDVRNAVVRLVEKCGKSAGEKLRDEYGVKKINDIPEVEWFNFIQKAEQLIANKETEVA